MIFNEKLKQKQGITLIALVVTIIVLLILAGISIAMLTGQNGILNRATEAKNANGTAQLDEQVKLAVAEALSNGLGTITDDNLREALNNNVESGNYDLKGDSKDGWTIKTVDKTYNISGNGDITGGTEDDGKGNASLDGIYSEGGVTEDQIAPNDLFEYEILNNTSQEGENTDLPTKTAKITRIKEVYCNHSGAGREGYDTEVEGDTNYEINYPGITDTLVIPYKVKLTNPDTGDEELYRITEVSLIFVSGYGEESCALPSIENIIYPNTVTKVMSFYGKIIGAEHKLKRIILSDNIEEIPGNFLASKIQSKIDRTYTGIEYIHLPANLKIIRNFAFNTAIYPRLDPYYDSSLSKIKINEINIPEGVEQIEMYAFDGWTNSQTINLPINRGDELPDGWKEALQYTKATIKYKDD